jgi:2-polyprenyl-6-methoxyphenol hydroxylase-like FAD-dependent oxidoreductase
MKVAICGAGVAGPTLAYWLERAGHEPTLIEIAPTFRTGGYIIDFWGVGYDVAERMGLTEELHSVGYRVEEVRFVRADGSKAGGFSADVFRRMTHDRYTSLQRGDLARVICDSIGGRVEMLFGQTIVSLKDSGHEVVVELSGGETRAFDLVVGADGLHSTVRRLILGDQAEFERPLGYHVAAFEVDCYPHRDDNVYVSYAEPGRSISRFAMCGERTMFLFVMADAHMPAGPVEALADQKGLLRDVFGESEWEAGEILSAMDGVNEIYFDTVSQIEAPQWSKGRSVLIGDAAVCVSLLAGEGTGLAMAEAYVLAHSIHESRGDVRKALEAYEARLRPFLQDKQKSARDFAGSFAPKTAFGIWLRNVAMKLMVIPPVADLLIGGSVKDDFELPDLML